MIAYSDAPAAGEHTCAELDMSVDLLRSIAQLSRKWMNAGVKGKGITLSGNELDLLNAVGLGHILMSAAAAEQKNQAIERRALRVRTDPPVPQKTAALQEAAQPVTASLDRRHDSLLRISDVRRRTGLSVATIYRRVDAKTFPPKVRLGPKCVAWYKAEIDAFVSDPAGYRAG